MGISHDEMVGRLCSAIGPDANHSDIANAVNVSGPCVCRALQRKSIPAKWLLTLMETRNVNPLWVLGKQSNMYIGTPDAKVANAETINIKKVLSVATRAELMAELSTRLPK